jgi:putative ATP-dependent endonuclease of the OLD family
MRLSRVIIEHFRGIRRLSLKLDHVTVLIGENNHGKTSVFDALCCCLGRPGSPASAYFRAADFRRGEDRGKRLPIRISLTFKATERDSPPGGISSHGPLNGALSLDNSGGQRLQVEFWGRPDDRRIEHRFVDEVGRPLDFPHADAALSELRRLHPVLLLRFAQRSHENPGDSAVRREGARSDQRGRLDLESQVASVYHDLAHTRGPVSKLELDRGIAAAEKLYDGIRARRGAGVGVGVGVGEGEGPDVGNPTLGVLMVLGAMLDVRGEELLPSDSDPVIAIEEPEVHMHPILLASTWDVIEGLGAQTLVTTNSGELLSSVPLHSLRRLTRKNGDISVQRLNPTRLTTTELRRVGYHIRAKRGTVLFARCWLLVEGESEFWLLRQLAHVLGFDLEAEGVRCVEFAQCGVAPLVKLANDLGIEWHLLADGDGQGRSYAQEAERYKLRHPTATRVTRLKHKDIERCLWHHGLDDVYREAAGMVGRTSGPRGSSQPGRVIAKAVRKHSKPYLAITVSEACAERGPSSVPPTLRSVIETVVALAASSA